jgi:ferredoxin
MPDLLVDGRPVSVPDGATLLDAARSLGVAIPTLCHRDGLLPHASCMVCLVEDERSGRMVPACATQAADGDRVRTGGGRLAAARRRSLELLLAEHEGDCEAPCTRACPAHPDIPGTIRLIAAGDLGPALARLMELLPLAGTLAVICPAPCRKACRRTRVDSAVDICGLKRAAARAGLADPDPFTPPALPRTGKSVAVIGAGPAGLSVAYFLAREGNRCVVFERADRPGGTMPAPADVLDADVRVLLRLGVQIRTGCDVTAIPDGYDAVVAATGSRGGFAQGDRVFPCGNVRLAQPTHLAVRSIADGRTTARAVAAFLGRLAPDPGQRRFDSHRHGPAEEDIASLVRRAETRGTAGARTDPVAAEALRCLDCDCLKKTSCRLRASADRLGADARRYATADRRRVEITAASSGLSLEPGKCIRCGTCVRIAEAAGDRPGLAFSGRGPALRVRVPFGDALDTALPTSAAACVAACPTGALAWDTARRKEAGA